MDKTAKPETRIRTFEADCLTICLFTPCAPPICLHAVLGMTSDCGTVRSMASNLKGETKVTTTYGQYNPFTHLNPLIFLSISQSVKLSLDAWVPVPPVASSSLSDTVALLHPNPPPAVIEDICPTSTPRVEEVQSNRVSGTSATLQALLGRGKQKQRELCLSPMAHSVQR